jgi:beta-xylosidase
VLGEYEGDGLVDWYGYYERSPEKDSQGPPTGMLTEGFYHTNRVDIRAAVWDAANPDAYFGYIGFRCARDEEVSRSEEFPLSIIAFDAARVICLYVL